jgi:hypothetical protein
MKPVTPDVSVRKLRDPFSTHLLVKIIVLVCIVALIGLGILVPIKLIPRALTSINSRLASLISSRQNEIILPQTVISPATPRPLEKHESLSSPNKHYISQNIFITSTDNGFVLESTSTNIVAKKINVTHHGNPAGTIIIIENK